MSSKASLNSRASIRRHVIVGCALVAFLGVGLGGWAATAEISGALIALQTGQRTMLSYLVKPLHDQLMRSFREK
jgi:hypothetical protein